MLVIDYMVHLAFVYLLIPMFIFLDSTLSSVAYVKP